MKVLGAVLAGGRSSRFGSDKAVALVSGRTLLDRVVEVLQGQCDGVFIVGRGEVPDWPEPSRGPLAGLAGALLHAGEHGFDAVLSSAVDSPDLPSDLRARLQPAPAFVNSQPVIGLWPVRSFDEARAILTSGESASLRAFAERIGARAVKLPREPVNINTPGDLARLEHSMGDETRFGTPPRERGVAAGCPIQVTVSSLTSLPQEGEAAAGTGLFSPARSDSCSAEE